MQELLREEFIFDHRKPVPLGEGMFIDGVESDLKHGLLYLNLDYIRYEFPVVDDPFNK